MTPPLILGSQSPRRREILGYFKIPFVQVSPEFVEEAIPFSGNPVEYVQTIARGKAESLLDSYRDHLVLTADTTVYLNGRIFTKPQNEDEAYAFLKELSGQWHSVYTCVVLGVKDKLYDETEETRVLFNQLTDEQMHMYYRSFSYRDKAGGYSPQGAGCLIVNKIEGCFYNSIGFPINAVRKLLLHVGIDLWNYLK